MHRHPFATDAYNLGYAIGVREDYDFQTDELENVDLPVNILDNEFHDPDIDRYIEQFEKYNPSVGILGDAYTEKEAEELNQIANKLREEHPHKEFIVVPKCREALELLNSDQVLGYPIGYSDIQASDFPTLWIGEAAVFIYWVHHRRTSTTQFKNSHNLYSPVNQPRISSDLTGMDFRR